MNQINVKIPVLLDEIIKLNPFAVTFRYDDLEIDIISVKEAEMIVGEVLKWAEKLIGS